MAAFRLSQRKAFDFSDLEELRNQVRAKRMGLQATSWRRLQAASMRGLNEHRKNTIAPLGDTVCNASKPFHRASCNTDRQLTT